MRVMFIGDSLSGGYFARTGSLGFAALLTAELSRLGDVQRVIASKPGGTVRAGGFADLPCELDLAVIELGTNDSLHTSPITFARHYGNLLDRVRERSPGVRMICVGLWRPPWRAWPYDAAIRRSARLQDAPFVRLSDLYVRADVRGPAGMPVESGTSDVFHPNTVGHAAIAERLRPFVVPA